jgi:hypothetical protein
MMNQMITNETTFDEYWANKEANNEIEEYDKARVPTWIVCSSYFLKVFIKIRHQMMLHLLQLMSDTIPM